MKVVRHKREGKEEGWVHLRFSPCGKFCDIRSFGPTETLKYFFYLFSDDSIISLDGPDAVVLNTEAHPLSILRD